MAADGTNFQAGALTEETDAFDSDKTGTRTFFQPGTFLFFIEVTALFFPLGNPQQSE